MTINEIIKQCKAIAEECDLNVTSIDVRHIQHYGKYINQESPLYVHVTTFYTTMNLNDETNFIVYIEHDELSVEYLMKKYELRCIKEQQASLPTEEQEKKATLKQIEAAI